MTYASKRAFLDDMRTSHDALEARLLEIPQTRWTEPGVWGDGWTVADLVAHLAEWQRMCLRWYADGEHGAAPAMPAPGFKWNQTPQLNREIQERHRARPAADSLADFEDGYQQLRRLVDALSERQLLEPGAFLWTGRLPLTSYLGPNTASHYRFALKVLKRGLPRAERRPERPPRRR